MKKIKLILVALFAVAMTLSCDDDGGDSKINVQEGAIPNIQKVDGSESFINLSELQAGNDISISVDLSIARGLKHVASVNVVGFYIKADGTIEKGILASNLTTFPALVIIKKETLLNTFTSLETTDDFGIGDELKISTDITLKDGTVLKLLKDDGTQNYGADIANSTQITPPINVTQSYFVSCPSELGGTFDFVTTNVGEPGGGTVAGPLTGSVTFTDNGGGNYSISDASFGGWLGLYGPGPDDTSRGVTLIDICGTLSFGGADQFDEIFTISNVTVNGSELSFHWVNDYGEFGDTVLTRTDGTDWPPLESAE